MRTEHEVKQMIAELKDIQDKSQRPEGRNTAKAVIAALENVLNGPKPTYGDERDWCGCVGPSGCCLCTIRRLAERPYQPDGQKEE